MSDKTASRPVVEYLEYDYTEAAALILAYRNRIAARRLIGANVSHLFRDRTKRRIFEAMGAAFVVPGSSWYDGDEVRRQLGLMGGNEIDFDLLDRVEESDDRLEMRPSQVVERLRFDFLRKQLWEGDLRELNEKIATGAGTPGDMARLLDDMARVTRPFSYDRDDSFEEFELWRANQPDPIPFGIDVVDALMPLGYFPGHQMTIAAAISNGKSTFVTSLADDLGQRRARDPIVFCWEAQRAETIAKFVQRRTGIPFERILFAKAASEEENEMIRRVSREVVRDVQFLPYELIRIEKMKLARTASGNCEAIDLVYGLVEERGACVAFFDLARSMLPSQRPDDLEEALSYARDLRPNFAAVYVHHLHEIGNDALSDSRGGKAWVSVPDDVWFCEIQDVVGEDVESGKIDKRRLFKIKCKKQRFGAAGWDVVSDFDGARATFANWRHPDVDDVVSTASLRKSKKKSR